MSIVGSIILITLIVFIVYMDLNEMVRPTEAQWALEQSIGVAMPELNYASEEKIIFHGYFGLFVYDLNTKSITHSLDLESIGCNAVQGDSYCDVSVSLDGNMVQLHPMNSDDMYVYNMEKKSLQKMQYEAMQNSFKITLNEEPNGSVSYETVKFENGDIGYLKGEDYTLNGLYYVVGNNKYKLFVGE